MTFASAEARSMAALRLAGGVFLLVAPQRGAQIVGGTGVVSPSSWVIRLLAARWVAQGAAEVHRPTTGVLAAGAGVDVLHAVSMLAVAACSSRHRRAALASAAIAALSAAGGSWTALKVDKDASP